MLTNQTATLDDLRALVDSGQPVLLWRGSPSGAALARQRAVLTHASGPFRRSSGYLAVCWSVSYRTSDGEASWLALDAGETTWPWRITPIEYDPKATD